ncbi:hypothetical protein ABK249_32350, partial [Neorhizobium sp. Rsf11]
MINANELLINRRLNAAASCNRQHICPSSTLKKRREKPMPKLLKTDMRISGGRQSQQIGCDMFDGGEVGRGVFGSDAAFVVAEDHVQHPV